MSRSEPTRVPGLADVVSVALGEYHACAVTEAGAVHCWGSNGRGQLGRGVASETGAPGRAGPLGAVTSLAVDGFHSCARRADGVYCWGKNEHGQLGLAHTRDEASPTSIPWLADARHVAAGGEHICAVGSDRTVRCAGRNDYGELGAGDEGDDDGGAPDRATPGEVRGLGPSVALSAGEWFTCAHDGDGAVWCWGRGTRGELGDGRMTSMRRAEHSVELARPAAATAAGERHACALTDDGCLWCWGSNEFGQLGDGGRAHAASPVRAKLACGPQ